MVGAQPVIERTQALGPGLAAFPGTDRQPVEEFGDELVRHAAQADLAGGADGLVCLAPVRLVEPGYSPGPVQTVQVRLAVRVLPADALQVARGHRAWPESGMPNDSRVGEELLPAQHLHSGGGSLILVEETEPAGNGEAGPLAALNHAAALTDAAAHFFRHEQKLAKRRLELRHRSIQPPHIGRVRTVIARGHPGTGQSGTGQSGRPMTGCCRGHVITRRSQSHPSRTSKSSSRARRISPSRSSPIDVSLADGAVARAAVTVPPPAHPARAVTAPDQPPPALASDPGNGWASGAVGELDDPLRPGGG